LVEYNWSYTITPQENIAIYIIRRILNNIGFVISPRHIFSLSIYSPIISFHNITFRSLMNIHRELLQSALSHWLVLPTYIIVLASHLSFYRSLHLFISLLASHCVSIILDITIYYFITSALLFRMNISYHYYIIIYYLYTYYYLLLYTFHIFAYIDIIYFFMLYTYCFINTFLHFQLYIAWLSTYQLSYY